MSDCILFRGYLTPHGYGQLGGGAGRIAHRVAWELYRGPIPHGMTVDHICFNRACINVEHLQLLTPEDNARRTQQSFTGRCKRGHPWADYNTYRNAGKRRCRTCQAHRAYLKRTGRPHPDALLAELEK